MNETRNGDVIRAETVPLDRAAKKARLSTNERNTRTSSCYCRSYPQEEIDKRKPSGYRERPGYVYFITDEYAVKIGVSFTPQSRIEEIQRYHPKKLRTIAIIPGTYEDERAYHSRFSDQRLHGEWFRYDYELKFFLEELCGKASPVFVEPLANYSFPTNYKDFQKWRRGNPLPAGLLGTKAWIIECILRGAPNVSHLKSLVSMKNEYCNDFEARLAER